MKFEVKVSNSENWKQEEIIRLEKEIKEKQKLVDEYNRERKELFKKNEITFSTMFNLNEKYGNKHDNLYDIKRCNIRLEILKNNSEITEKEYLSMAIIPMNTFMHINSMML